MRKEYLTIPLALYAIRTLATTAFTRPVAKEIGRNQKWTCQGLTGDCDLGIEGQPASYKTGFMVEIAHFDHTRNDEYNEHHNGRCSYSCH